MTDEGIELVITLMEAKDLIGPSNADQFDTFVRIYMIPDDQAPLQTKVSTKSIHSINVSPLSTNYDNRHRLNAQKLSRQQNYFHFGISLRKCFYLLQLFRNSKCPTFNETFSFWLSNKTRTKRTLCFHLYHSGSVHTLIGE